MEEKTIYIHETQSMSCDNGELYIEGEFGSIIWNCETLFTDLPYIIKLTLKSRAKTDKFVREQIAEITKLISE
jgi:hypothetical protein